MRRFGAGGKAARAVRRASKKGWIAGAGPAMIGRSGQRVASRRMLASNLRHLSAFRVALLATLAVALVYLPGSQLGLVQQLEGELLDLRFHARPPQPTSGAITLVLIDDPSLAELGRWPWSRSLMAELVERLAGRRRAHDRARSAAGRARAQRRADRRAGAPAAGGRCAGTPGLS